MSLSLSLFKRVGFCVAVLVTFFVLGCKGPAAATPQGTPDTPSATEPGSKPGGSQGWESSGGDGVACFDSQATAQEAQALLDSGKGLTQELREKVQTLVTLEYWENHEKVKFANEFLVAEGMNDESAILNVVTTTLKRYSPLFYSKFVSVQTRMEPTQWGDDKALPDVRDSKPVTPIETADAKCRLIQLAVRYTRSTPGKIPEVRVDFDGWLYAHKLDALNRVILQSHEIFYLIAKEGGHPDSQAVRPLVVTLLNMDFQIALMRFGNSKAIDLVQNAIGSVYGDYYRFFVNDASNLPAVAVPPGPHQYSRYKSFGSAIAPLRARKGKCLTEKKFDDAKPEERQALLQTCADFAMSPNYINDAFNDEESFVFVARYFIDRLPNVIDNSESFLVWEKEHPEATSPYIWQQLARACEVIPGFKRQYLGKLFDKAEGYCKSLPLPAVDRSIMERF